MLIETVGILGLVAGFVILICASVWSAWILNTNTGGVFNPSMIAGIFVFYLALKIRYGEAAFQTYVIGLIALGVIILDAVTVYKKYGGRTALARILSAVYGVLIFLAIAFFSYNSSNRRRQNRKREDKKW